MVKRAKARGFTLLEVLIASAVAAIALSAAFGLMSFQVQAFTQQQDVQQIASSSRILEDTVGHDLRSAGFGTSFYAGLTTAAAFSGRAMVTDGGGQELGIPAVRLANDAQGPLGGPGLGVQVGSDAVTLLRVEGASTQLPSSAAGLSAIAAGGGAGPYQVERGALLRPCGRDANGSRLVLISDMVRSREPASMVAQIATMGALDNFITLVNGPYGIDPGSVAAPTAVLPAPRSFGPGSLVTCVRLVTYWVDNLGRLRMFQSSPANPGGTAGLTGSFGGPLPISPATDAVVAEGVVQMQIALLMGGMYPGGAGWVFAEPGPSAPPAPVTDQQLVEVRGARISAILASAKSGRETVAVVVSPMLEDFDTSAGTFPPRFTYREVSTTVDLRNLRLYDLLSSGDRTWDLVRSYP